MYPMRGKYNLNAFLSGLSKRPLQRLPWIIIALVCSLLVLLLFAKAIWGGRGQHDASSGTNGSTQASAIDGSSAGASGLGTRDALPCPMWPADNVWNRRVDVLPTQVASDAYVASLHAGDYLHAGFGAGSWQGSSIGIPYNVVPTAQPPVPVHFLLYSSESDRGPYPYPRSAFIQGATSANPVPASGDRHVAVLRAGDCMLFESWHSEPQADGSWNLANGATFNLRSNALRPDGWTSADAAGFAILPSLLRYDEVASGLVTHAVRFTGLPETVSSRWTWPARHSDGTCASGQCPPMGTRFRLKAGTDISGFSPHVRTILQGLKTYGMMLADSGDSWHLGGTVDQRWDDAEMQQLQTIHGSDFEAVDVSGLMLDPDSARSK